MTATAVPGIVQNTPEWLTFRNQHIGGSDAPVIAGETRSLFELVSEKRGLIPHPEFDEAAQLQMKVGHLLEDDLMAIYPDLTGRTGTRRHGICLSAEWPVASCSPDGEVHRRGLGERRGIQFKVSRSPKWGTALAAGDLVPGDVYAQVQHEMYVMEWDVEDVPVFLYGTPKVIEVPRSDEYIDNLLYFEREAWAHVENGTLPEPDSSEGTRRAIAAMHPRDDGTMLPRSAEFEELARQLQAVKADIKEAEGLEGSISNAVRMMLGDASGVEGCFTYRKNKDSVRINWPAVAGAFRQLLTEQGTSDDALEALVSVHSEAAPGPRVLRLVLKESAS
jgi:predicted phage-related endonuclease